MRTLPEIWDRFVPEIKKLGSSSLAGVWEYVAEEG